MRIVVIDIAASSGGAMTILKSFYNFVAKNADKNNEWIFLLSDTYLKETKNIKIECFPDVKRSKAKKLLFDFIYGHKIIEKYNPDIVLSLQNIAIFGLKIPQIVYLHQSIPFQSEKPFSFFKREERTYAVYQYLIGTIIKLSLKKATHVVVQTEWMKQAVRKKVKMKKNKITVVRPPYENKSCLTHQKKWNKNKFFYPTSDSVYKNIDCIVQAQKAVIAQKKYDADIEITVNGTDKNNIHYIGQIQHEEVLNKLGESTLVFPSYIESAPLPLLEARSAGTVVLASDCNFSRELLSGYSNAYFFDPFKPDELAGLMAEVMDGKIVRHDVVEEINLTGSWEELIHLLEELQ